MKMQDRNTEVFKKALDKLIAQTEKVIAQNQMIIALMQNQQEQNKVIVSEILSLLRPVGNPPNQEHADSGTRTPSPKEDIQKCDAREVFLQDDVKESLDLFKKIKRYNPPRKSPIVI